MASKYARSPTIKRILREAAELAQSPSPDFHAAPANESDLFDWHFTVRGPPSSAFANGIYHGRIILPPTYPLRPPSFRFLNSSGRFEVNREICLSISGHHEETWMPAWGVRTALVALRSFMETDPKGQLGGMECSTAERENLARESISWTCGVCQKRNEDILKESEEAYREIILETNTSQIEKAPSELPKPYKGELIRKDQQGNDETIWSKNKSRDKDVKHTSDFPNTKNIGIPPDKQSESSKTAPSVLSASVRPSSLDLQQRTSQPIQAPLVRLINEESPLWIDTAIATIIICLVAMVMKVLLGLGRNFSWESN